MQTTSSANCSRKAEHALCDIGINYVEKLHNEARNVRGQVENKYGKAVEQVRKSTEACKDAVTSNIASAIESLQKIQQSVHEELEQKSATEIQRIESERAQLRGTIDNVAQFCERRVQNLQISGGLEGGEWDDLLEAIEGQEKHLTDICNTRFKLTYKTFTKPGTNDMSAVIDSFETLRDVKEEETEIAIEVEKGHGVASLPNQLRSSSMKKLVRQSRFHSDHNTEPEISKRSLSPGRQRRNRLKEKERVMIKQAFSEDTSTSLTRVVLTSHAAESRARSPKPDIEPEEIDTGETDAIGKFNCQPHVPLPPNTKPPLPVRRPRRQEQHQGLQPVLENQESVAKVIKRVVPCHVIKADDANPLQPLGIVGLEVNKVAIASGNGFKILENGQDVTPVRNVRSRSPRRFTDVCCLPDGTLLAVVEGTKDIFKYNRYGMPVGVLEIVDMGKRLKNPMMPFGIVCDRAGNVYISDRGNRCILVCGNNGNLRHLIGCKGLPDERLQDPLYLALNQPTESLIHVTDGAKKVIFTYMIDHGAFIRVLSGGAGGDERSSQATATIAAPVGIVSTVDGQIVVTDRKSNNVKMLEPVTGALIKEFGSKGSNRGEFDTPMGVAFIDNKLAVCDSNNYRIQLFDWPLS